MTNTSIVVLSDSGDPANPRTWSGTPYNLMRSFQKLGATVSAANLMQRRSVRGALSILSWATGHGKQYRRTPLASAFYRLRIPSENFEKSRTVVLHTGTSTTPLALRTKGVRHALFLDSTFHMMSVGTLLKYGRAAYREYDQFERRAVASVEHVFAVSECVRTDIIEHYSIPAERVTAVGTGTGNIRPAEGEKDYSACSVLFVAKERFEEKGGLLLLDGFRIAQKADRRLKLIVVAREPYRHLIEGVPGATFKTTLPWEELESCFNEASLFAMPALYEPWGLVYLEALACRTPVLGMNRNALPELTKNGKYGFLLNEANPSAVAEELLRAFSDTKQLEKMGREGQEYIMGRYSWDKTALKISQTLF